MAKKIIIFRKKKKYEHGTSKAAKYIQHEASYIHVYSQADGTRV
jgi:hypothetical protein